ncbi:glycosyltransferase family 4 protein [Chloroflexi bacterium TSY]|nr:glycosyltransferase family 4 protein [Chloroflexi bacterium TSY]
MHILFVTGEYPPRQGGVGAYTAELGRALTELGTRVTALTTEHAPRISDNHSAAPARTDELTFRHDPFEVERIIKRWNWRIWTTVGKWARLLTADWIHVQYQTAAFGMNPAINFAPAIWKRQQSSHLIRIAWTYHDLLVPYLFPKAGETIRCWVTETPARASHLTIVTNNEDQQQLAQRAIPAISIPIGSNIQSQRFSEIERAQRRTMRGYQEHDWVIAYFGFLNRSKGGVTLIHTLHQLTQRIEHVQLLMIGDRVGASDPTNYAYLQEIETLIHELGLDSRVLWTGRQSDADVAADLNACNVLVMPYEDGASLRRGTLMAGLANGCAIVTTKPKTPIHELVDGRDLRYVSPGEPVETAQVLTELYEQPDLVASLQHNARLSSRIFSWASIAERHLTCYVGED